MSYKFNDVDIESTLNSSKYLSSNIQSRSITSGNTWIAGIGYYGQLGLGDALDRSAKPVQLTSGNLKFKYIIGGYSISGNYVYGIAEDNKLYSWGYNGSNQYLGYNNSAANQLTPREVVTGTSVLHVSTSGPTSSGTMPASHGCVRTDGTAWVWGAINVFPIGGGSGYTTQITPVQVPNVATFRQIEAMCYNTYLLDSLNRCWWFGTTTQAAQAVTRNQVQHIDTALTWKTISASTNRCLGITTDNKLYIIRNATTAASQIGTATDWDKCYTTIHSSYVTKTNGTLWYVLSGTLTLYSLSNETGWVDFVGNLNQNSPVFLRDDGYLWYFPSLPSSGPIEPIKLSNKLYRNYGVTGAAKHTGNITTYATIHNK